MKDKEDTTHMTRDLPIAYGNSCHAKTWSNKVTTWEDLCSRLSTTIRTTESAEEYPKMKKADRDAAKDKGGFVGGQLRDNRRKLETVVCRSMLTMDADNAEVGFIDKFTDPANGFKHTACLYTTHGHIPAAPRCRIIIPLTRDITPDEYAAIARYFAADWGIDQFDECSYKPNQLMYWPTTPSNGEFICKVTEGEWLNPDDILSAHPNWQDCSLLPTSSRESIVHEKVRKAQEDPLTKKGTVGLFCRAYSIEDVIEKFLPDVYEPSTVPGRYDYIAGQGSAGVVTYDGKFAYSHHATDPACGKLLNAFDLVRIHKFGDDDGKKTFKAMCAFAMSQEEVRLLAMEEKQKAADEDFAEAEISTEGIDAKDGNKENVSKDEENKWKKDLTYSAMTGELDNSLQNLRLILQNDKKLRNIVFNQLADDMEIKGDVPWKHPAKFWRDADDSQLVCYVDERYGEFSARNYDIAVEKVVDDRSYHPIRDYFSGLTEWDGVKRVDTLLIDYLGADDNTYTRAVTRKALCAAHRRVYNPGIKFDNMTVLNGPQGIGKSTFIENLGGQWYSDSLCLTDMNDKTAAEKLQGYWIIEIGEMAGMKKADIEKVKAFVSRKDDKYRASFGRRSTPHPRQCIFFGTTNSENGFLRDITGNRRFWVIKVNGKGKYKPWDMKKEIIDQIWAEVNILAEAGEELYLPADLEEFARREQCDAMEQDEREGVVREYLDMLLPANWDDMDLYARRNYIRDTDDPTRPRGVKQRDTVSNMEIWCECFGKNKEDLKSADSYGISAIMMRISNWEKTGNRVQIPLYGQQRIYGRKP